MTMTHVSARPRTGRNVNRELSSTRRCSAIGAGTRSARAREAANVQ